MNRLVEYSTHHPYLIVATVIVAVLAVVFELRSRGKGSTTIGATDAVRLHNQGALMLDIRDREQFVSGHIIDARNIVREKLKESLDTLKKYREKPVIVCCENGAASAAAVKELRAQGFNKAVNLRGGLAAWRQENYPLVTDTKEAKRA
jgi:rhodanese-related sulfurtransferase